MKRIKYGTYGYLALLLAAQLSIAGVAAPKSVDRAVTDAKKSGRSVKRTLKKTGRDVTGQGSAWEDTKDSVKDGAADLKDEAKYHKKQLEKKAD